MANISINPDKTINVNGKKTFPIYMDSICNLYMPYTDNCNISKNTEFLFSSGGSPNVNLTQAVLDQYATNNVFFTMLCNNSQSALQSVIDHPNMFGWYSYDEPRDTQLPTVSDLYTQTKAKDPNHPVILNHWKDMMKWAPYCDIITWDNYLVISSPVPSWYNTIAGGLRENAVYAYEVQSQAAFFKNTDLNTIGKPVYAVIQANGVTIPGAYLAVPTTQEARATTYTAITMDVKGIGFWGYLSWGFGASGGTSGLYLNPTLHTYYKALASELNFLNDVLVLPTLDYHWASHPGSMVTFSKTLTRNVGYTRRDVTNFNYILKQSGGTSYLIVVNKDSRPIPDVTITVKGLTGTTIATTLGTVDAGSIPGIQKSVVNGSWSDNFAGYDVKIYQIGDAPPPPLPPPPPPPPPPLPDTEKQDDILPLLALAYMVLRFA